MYKKLTLPNGLRLLLIPLKEAKTVTVSVYVKAGSRFESAKENGLSHFLEHMVFKGTESFGSQRKLAEQVEGIGADWNGSTGYELVNYYIRSEPSHLALTLKILFEMLFKPLFNETDIKGEKGVIIEEINMYNDMPQYRAVNLVNSIQWPNHPLGRDVAGTKETVNSFLRDDLISYKAALFGPGNMVVGVSGCFDEERVRNLMEPSFGQIEAGSQARSFEMAPREETKRRVISEIKDTEQTNFVISFRGVGRSDPKRYALRLLSVIMGEGISSRLFQRLRTELGLAYNISTSVAHFIDTGTFATVAGVKNTESLRSIRETLGMFDKLADGGVGEGELKKAKEYLKGGMAIELEEQESLNNFLCRQELLLGSVKSYEETIKKIDKVTLSEANELAKNIFVKERACISTVGKLKESEVLDAAR